MAKIGRLMRPAGGDAKACGTREFWLMAMVCAAVAVLPATTVGAQEPGDQPIIRDEPGKAEPKVGDPQNGLKTARTLCATCHLIGEPPNSGTAADVPSFSSIANRPNQSTQKLSNWLIEPHVPMPNLHLTRKEIRDLAAYILTLRTAQ